MQADAPREAAFAAGRNSRPLRAGRCVLRAGMATCRRPAGSGGGRRAVERASGGGLWLLGRCGGRSNGCGLQQRGRVGHAYCG